MKIKLSPALLIGFAVAAIVSVLVANYDKLLPHRWETYTPPDGVFSIEFPGKPSVETAQVPVEGGGTVTANMISAKPTDDAAYSCMYTEDRNVGSKAPAQVLESALDGSMRKIQGTVLNKKQITVQGNPGLEAQARARGESMVDIRLVVVGDRLYMIMAVATEQGREAKTVQRLFDSFKLDKK